MVSGCRNYDISTIEFNNISNFNFLQTNLPELIGDAKAMKRLVYFEPERPAEELVT